MSKSRPKTAAEEVFEPEFDVLATIEQIAAEGLPTPEDWQREFVELTRKYRALLKHAVKITGISDMMQKSPSAHSARTRSQKLGTVRETSGPDPCAGGTATLTGLRTDPVFSLC